MPEIKNNFSQGKMNQDLDERIVPKGQYRDAMNIQISTSEQAGVGTVQNILGNTRIENIVGGGWNTVGTIADEKNNKLYWLAHNSGKDAIFEYNLEDNTTVPVIIDTNLDVLKFDGNLITGINIVDDILMWTDNVNEPRKINITRCKLGADATSPNSTHTKLVVNDTVTSADIAEEHITVIKKRPSMAPRFNVNESNFQELFEANCDFSQGSSSIDDYNTTPFYDASDTTSIPNNASGDGTNLVVEGDSAYIRIPKIAGDWGPQISASIKGNLVLGTLDSNTLPSPHYFNGGNYGFPINPFSPGTYTNSNLPIISRYHYANGAVDDIQYDATNERIIFDNLDPYDYDTTTTGDGYLNIKLFEDATNGPYAASDEHQWSPGDELTISFDWHSVDTSPKTFTIVLLDYVSGASNTGFGNNWVELTRYDYVSDGVAGTTESFSHDFYIPTTHTGGLVRARMFNGGTSMIGDLGGPATNDADWIDNLNMRKVSEGFQNPDHYEPTNTIIVPNTVNINSGDAVDIDGWTDGSGVSEPTPHVEIVNTVGSDYEVELSGEPDTNVYTNIDSTNWPSMQWDPTIQISNFNPAINYTNGDIVLLSQLSSAGVLPVNFEVRGEITNIYQQVGTPGFTELEIEIISINNNIPTTAAQFNTAPNPNVPGLAFKTSEGIYMNVVKEVDISKIFEDKFIRFATRWKYEDGEYSAFSPFTDVAFLASAFSFHPSKDMYNLGMENNCQDIEILDFVEPSMPEDVIQVDILIKPENSTTVYSLESIKPNDPLPPGASTNNWNNTNHNLVEILNNTWTNYNNLGAVAESVNLPTAYKGKYTVSTENIHAALPANQMLRPWDNVPKKALAQEITGNRLVYGNYTQGYNMLEGSNITKPYLDLNYRQRSFLDSDSIDFASGQKSLKTFRTYQLGVVYGDEHGRETPIFTSENASLQIPWDADSSSTFSGNASRSTQLTAVLRGNQPDFASYYKFFIKQTSGEYYNLSMDRVYRAEDNDNLWISFLSADVNKVQKGEYIILKKRAETEEQVEINNKFKIADIKNEAPEWIKYRRTSIGHVGGAVNMQNLFPGYSNSLDIPEENQDLITIDRATWVGNDGISLTELDKDFEYLEIQFTTLSGSAVLESQRYRISGIELVNNDEEYKIKLYKVISSGDNWVSTDGVVDSNLKVKIFKVIKKENNPQFHGRFFVKIISNNITQTYLEQLIGINTTYKVNGLINTFYFADEQAPSPANDHTAGIVNSVNSKPNHSQDTKDLHTEEKSNTKGAWEVLYKYGEASITEGWFIDHCYFASGQQIDPSDPTGQTGMLQADLSGRMTYGGDSAGTNGENYVDSCQGVLDITGIGAFDTGGDVYNTPNWGGRSWLYKFGTTPMGSGSGQNSFDDIYDIGSTSGVTSSPYYMHLSFGPVGEDLWVKDSPTQYGGLGFINSSSFDWQNINPGAFPDVHGDYIDDQKHQDQWKIQDEELKSMASKLIAGAKFKFASSEEVFTIEKTSVKRLYNHTPFMNRHDAWESGTISLNNSVQYAWDQLHDDSQYMTDSTLRGLLADKLVDFGSRTNRRLLYILKLDKHPNDYNISFTWDADSLHKIRFVESVEASEDDIPLISPAVWETEQKTDVDLNIYHEASGAIPLKLNDEKQTSETFAPIGSRVWCSKSGSMPIFSGANEGLELVVTNWDTTGSNYSIVELASPGLNVNPDGSSSVYTNDQTGWDTQTALYLQKPIRFFKPDGSFVTSKIVEVKEIIGEYITKVQVGTHNWSKTIGLSYHDCFSFGNGVESNRIRDDFNAMVIGKGVKASTVFEGQYKEENRKNGLIYSGIYNSTSGVNNLNQFIQAEKITKDLNPTFGSIQKLFQRRIDLVTFCEDRVVKVMSNKDALYNADGNSQLIATNRVLGDANPFAGDYGISKDPSSFAKESYRAYFADKQRGAVLRLSMDGLTPISDVGMHDYFRDNLRNANNIIASYDDRNGDYNLTIDNNTLSFNEKVKGWTSFKSFVPETGISVANNYYTFDNGRPWLHHVTVNPMDTENIDRNTFYVPTPHNGSGVVPSSITTLLNDQPQAIKSYNTLNYEGDDGWTCNNFITDQQRGTVPEFIEKEGKWFNYIRGTNDVDLQAFNFQGIGQTIGIEYNI